MLPKRKKQSLCQTLKKHEDHPKKLLGGTDSKDFIVGDTKEEYLMVICSCGELIVYDKIRVLDGDPFNITTYGGAA